MAYKNIEDKNKYAEQWRKNHSDYMSRYMKKYYRKNKEEILKRKKQWLKNNPERERETRKEYYKNNSGKIKEKSKKWKKDNPEKAKEYDKQWRKNNIERRKKAGRKWRKNNCEKMKEYHKKYHIEFRKRKLRTSEQWRKDNPEKIKQWRKDNPEKIKQWRKDNPEKIKEYINQWTKQRLKTDLKFNLNFKMRRAICESLKGDKAGRRWEGLTGYALADLKKRLNKTMPTGYTWQDFLQGKLHIDHIIPISAFNFTKPEHTDFKRCWELENLQLLPARENLIKHTKLSKPFQPALRI